MRWAELSPREEVALEERGDSAEGVLAGQEALTASGVMATGSGSAMSSHSWDAWARDTMSPWTAAPISVPAISMVIPGTKPALEVTQLPGPGQRHPPPLPNARTHGTRWRSPALSGWGSGAW